jgi:hypothetical protein
MMEVTETLRWSPGLQARLDRKEGKVRQGGEASHSRSTYVLVMQLQN